MLPPDVCQISFAPLIPIVLILSTAAPLARSPRIVRVVGTEYAFQMPAHIKAGETLFTFENQGTVRHEMSIALLKDGFSADSVIAAVIAGSRHRTFVDGQAALIVAGPGEPPGPRLWIDVQAGRTYLVICTLRDTPEAPPHVTLGMITSFRAE